MGKKDVFFLSIVSLDHDWEESEVGYTKTRGFLLLRSPGFLTCILADSLRISWRDYSDLFHIIPNFLNKFKRAKVESAIKIIIFYTLLAKV